MATGFINDAIFPTDISNGSLGGPLFVTFVQSVQSGNEQRVSAWPYGRHMYEVQYGVKTPILGSVLLRFFHSMRGRAFGFRYLDPMDYKSCYILNTTANNDQVLIASALGGETTTPLVKTYTTGSQSTIRPITRPITGSVKLAINAIAKTEGVDFTVDYETGIVTFLTALTILDLVTAGYEFHVPCRFDADRLPMNLAGPLVSSTRVAVIEIRS